MLTIDNQRSITDLDFTFEKQIKNQISIRELINNKKSADQRQFMCSHDIQELCGLVQTPY